MDRLEAKKTFYTIGEQVVDNVDGHIEVHEEVVEEVATDGPEPADEKPVDQLAVEQVDLS